MSTDNYYALLDLDPSVESPSEIEDAIAKKEREWNHTYNTSFFPADKVESQNNIERLGDIREVMLNDPVKRRNHADERRDQLRCEQDDLLRRVRERIDTAKQYSDSGHEYILEQEFQVIVNEFSQLSESDIRQEVDIDIVADHPARAEFLATAEFVTIVKCLESLEKDDLYDLLDRPRSTDRQALLDRTNDELSRVRKIAKKTASVTAMNTLLRKCLIIFDSDDQRSRYDNSLDRYPIEKALREHAERILKRDGEFSTHTQSNLENLAEKHGLDLIQVRIYLHWLEGDKGQSKVDPNAPSSRPQKCPNSACGEENEAGTRICSHCKTPILTRCQRCSEENLASAKACRNCSFDQADSDRFAAHIKQARDLLRDEEFKDAAAELKLARNILPDSPDASRVEDDLKAAEFGAELKQARILMNANDLDAAEDCLTRAAHIRPNDRKIADLRDEIRSQQTASVSMASLQAAIDDEKDERKILSIAQSLEKLAGPKSVGPHKARVGLARRRVKAYDDLHGTAADLEGDELFVREYLRVTSPNSNDDIQLSSCRDDKIRELKDRFESSQDRIKSIDALRAVVADADNDRASETMIADEGRSFAKDCSIELGRYFPELSVRVALAEALDATPLDHEAVAKLWKQIQSQAFQPKCNKTIELCERISTSLQATKELKHLTEAINEEDDRAYLELYRESNLAKVDIDGSYGDRFRTTSERIHALDKLEGVIQQAEIGKATELDIAEAADDPRITPHYDHRHSTRVKIARALAGRPRSDRAIARAAEQIGDNELPQCPGSVEAIRVARRRIDLLDRISTIDSSRPLEMCDEELVDLWDAELLDPSEDAHRWKQDVDEAALRLRSWAELDTLLTDGGDPQRAGILRDTVKDYTCAIDREQEIDDLIELGKQMVEPMLNALKQKDDKAFVDCFRPDVINDCQEVFGPHMEAIEEVLTNSPHRIQAHVDEPAWTYADDNNSVRLHWTVHPSSLVSKSDFAASLDGFYATSAEAKERLRHVDHRRNSVARIPVPELGASLYVTVWPVVQIGSQRIRGQAAQIGPIRAPQLTETSGIMTESNSSGSLSRLRQTLRQWVYKIVNH